MQRLTGKVPSAGQGAVLCWQIASCTPLLVGVQVLVSSRGIASARADAQLTNAKQPIMFAQVLVGALVFFSSRLSCQLGAPVLVGAVYFRGGRRHDCVIVSLVAQPSMQAHTKHTPSTQHAPSTHQAHNVCGASPGDIVLGCLSNTRACTTYTRMRMRKLHLNC